MTAPTNTGILTDKEGTGFPGVRIDDRPFTCLPFVQRYLDAIPKKAKVCFQTTDGKISKIWEEKEPAAAAGNNKSDCTSSGTPALKTVEGQITFLDIAAHKIIVKDRTGQTTTFIWAPPMHDQMAKLQQWWFTKLTGEHEPEFGMYRLTAQEFFKRPSDWPASAHGGKGGYQPRNEKPIIYQVCYKEACETMRQMFIRDGEKWNEQSFNSYMDLALERAKKDAKALIEAAGVSN